MVVTEVAVEYEVLLVVVAQGSPYRSCWLQLFVPLVIVPAGLLLSFLLVVIGCVACGHPCILLIIIDLFLIFPSKLVSSSSMNHLLLLCCPIDAAGPLFFRIKKRIYYLFSVRFLQLAALSDGCIEEGGRVIVRTAVCCLLRLCLGDEGCWEFGWG